MGIFNEKKYKTTKQSHCIDILLIFFRGAVAGGSGGACTENYLVNLPALFNGLALCYVKQNVLGKVRLLWSSACFFRMKDEEKVFLFLQERKRYAAESWQANGGKSSDL